MTTCTKVIFLDIDGPMIPLRAYFLPDQTSPVSVFDPCATSLLLRLIKDSGAQIVISSTWGLHGYGQCADLLKRNGIDPALMHKDWITPRKMSSYRVNEIQWWLDRHPEVTHYVAIDDEGLTVTMVPNSVLCDAHEGFSWRNYLECCIYLDTFNGPDDPKRQHTADLITYFKRREIWRTKRTDEPGQPLTWHYADLLFPPIPPNSDDAN